MERVQYLSEHHRLAIWPGRLIWLSILGLVIILLAVNAPANVLYARTEYQVQLAREAILAFTSLHSFAQWLVAVRWLVVTVYFSAAFLIAWRKWGDWLALLVSAALLLLAWGFVMRPNSNTWQYPGLLLEIIPLVGAILPQLPIVSLVLLFFLFPDGRFVFPWLKWLAMLPIMATALFSYAEHYYQKWGDYPVALGQLAWPVWIALLLLSCLVALAGQVYRYHQVATPSQRQQMKWVLLGLASMLSVPLLSWPLQDWGGSWGALVSIGINLGVATFLPITIGFSILRYRLWDVDFLINRALVYGVLTTIVLGLYGLSIGAVSALIPAQGGWLVSLLALAIVGVLAPPLRQPLQALADRWLPAVPPAEAVQESSTRVPSSGRFALRLARFAWLVLFILLLCAIAIQLANLPYLVLVTRSQWILETALPTIPTISADTFARYIVAMRLGVLAVFWGTALLLFWRQRDDGMALFVAFLLLLLPYGLMNGETSPLAEQLSLPSIALVAVLPFLFPDGHVIPRSTRRQFALLSLLISVSVLTYGIASLVAPRGTPENWAYFSFIATFASLMVAGVASQAYRYRVVATAVQRQQTKWVLLGLGAQLLWLLWLILALSGVLAWIGLPEAMVAFIMLHLILLIPVAMPVTIGFSVLRHRLWDVDIIINRTLVFGGLTLLVAILYVLVVGLLGVIFQTGGNLFFSILVTGLVAILFHPLRQRLQRVVNRMMYGERDDPVAVLTRLGERLEAATAPQETLPTLVETVGQALKLPYVALELREGDLSVQVATYGEYVASKSADLLRLSLTYREQKVGDLIVAPRSPGEFFSPAERRLLENVARQAGTAVYAAQLTAQLQRSRARLVSAREEERRRIRRDLHDGLGPQLASLNLKLDAARNLLHRDSAATEKLLLELKAQTQDAIADIRHLVYELRPPALDQLGLLSALREYASSHNGGDRLQIVVEGPPALPPLPAAMEVAAYRIALEAMTNALRHAGARSCTVRVALDGGLQLEICDDGQGLPDLPVAGVGLVAMRERATELGGTLVIESTPGKGTTVRAHLPFVTQEP